MATSLSEIGLIGLAVMGENLVLNMESKGFKVSVYNRTTAKVHDFLASRAQGKNIIGTCSIEEFCQSLERPRKIMMMVKAGKAIDELIAQLMPELTDGDILIDGGNSHYEDTIRRTKELKDKGIFFIGAGISGGEEGALHGPSIMPGGQAEAWPSIKPIFQAVAAKVADGTPCCDWVGSDGAGHFVKMVHNGIEYSDMQLICEAYHLLSTGLSLNNDAIHDILETWNQGHLNSYLIQITRDIMLVKDESSGKPILDLILDSAGQKGTGKWTSVSALDMGIPVPQIAEAVFARCMSALKEERVKAAKILSGPSNVYIGDKHQFVSQLHDALLASKICSYAQGFQLLSMSAAEFKWELNLGSIALMWREGCIIRAGFLEKIKDAYTLNPKLPNLLIDPYFTQLLNEAQNGWRQVINTAVTIGIPLPSMSSALSYYDSYRSSRLAANLLQAQRDYFGAHTYERIDRPRGQFFHTDWTGHGGKTASTTYNV